MAAEQDIGWISTGTTHCVYHCGFLYRFGPGLVQPSFRHLDRLFNGLLNIIPYLGLYISLGIALLTGFFTPTPLISMLKIGGIFLIVQAAEAYIISPKIVGERVGLHPIAVIFSILVFSRFLGFWGLIIGVPTAALIKFLLVEWKRRQKWKEIMAGKHGSEN